MESDDTLTDEERHAAGQRLRDIRLDSFDTQAALEAASGVSAKTIGNIEAGLKARPSSIRKILRALPDHYANELRELFRLPPTAKSGPVTGRSSSASEADMLAALRALEERVEELERGQGR